MGEERFVQIEKLNVKEGVIEVARTSVLPIRDGLHATEFGEITVIVGGIRKTDGTTKVILQGGSIVFNRERKRRSRYRQKLREVRLQLRRTVYLPVDLKKSVSQDISPFERLRFRQVG